MTIILLYTGRPIIADLFIYYREDGDETYFTNDGHDGG